MKILARFKWPIVLAMLGLATEIVAVGYFVHGFRDTGTSFTAPGETSVTISKPGKYTLWHECKTIIDGQAKTFPDDLPAEATVKVVSDADGSPVLLRKRGSAHMNKRGIRRVSMGELKFSSPGKYRITVSGLPEKRAFYLDESKFVKMFLTVIPCVFMGLAFLFAAFVFGVYVLTQIIHERRHPQTVGADRV